MNTSYIPQDHPVAQLLRMSANSGQALTGADLASLDRASQHIPGGGSFTGMKADITAASQQIAELRAQGRYQDAREVADQTTAQLAGRMTEGQRSVTTQTIQAAEDNAADVADIDAMVRRSIANS